jgi:hypothetical protein
MYKNKLNKIVIKILTVIILLFSISTFLSCDEETNDKWKVTFSIFSDEFDHLVLVHNQDYSENHKPYNYSVGSKNILFEEIHEFEPLFSDPMMKIFDIEINDSSGITSFYFNDNNIYKNLNCFVYQNYEDQGYYRIHKGFVSGKKRNGVWEIDFNISYGGENNDKYKMIKGAKY